MADKWIMFPGEKELRRVRRITAARAAVL